MKRFVPKYVLNSLESFFRMEASSGLVLALAAVAAMLIANSSWSDFYFSSLSFKFAGLSVQHWINDGLMVIFFFVIGMELKKEILTGELSSRQKAALPVAAALGGMVAPALIYYFLNPQGAGASGWGVPMATDIAFALGILSLFGKRVPLSLKVFLLALAIVDDLGAILVIAFFYTKEIRYEGLLVALVALAVMWGERKKGIKSYAAYVPFGVLAWFGVLYSGVHATVAGVLIGFLTPLSFKVSKDSAQTYSPLDNLVHYLHPWVSFGIMPVFALANAGIDLRGLNLSELIAHPIHQGVALGLFLGKPLGIIIFSGLFVLVGWGQLPKGLSWSHILGMGFLAGIGFTMSLFISSLALPVDLETYSKAGIIFGSLLSALVGAVILSWVFRRYTHSKISTPSPGNK